MALFFLLYLMAALISLADAEAPSREPLMCDTAIIEHNSILKNLQMTSAFLNLTEWQNTLTTLWIFSFMFKVK